MHALRVVCLPLVCLLFSSGLAFAAPFYQENFNYNGSRPQDTFDALLQTGWGAFRSGSKVRVFGNLKVVPGITRDQPAFDSFPSGPDDGYAFWSKDVLGLTIFTEEYSFNIGTLAEVSYLQRLGGATLDPTTSLPSYNGTRLAFRIRSTDGVERWYLSDQIFRPRGLNDWDPVDVSVNGLTWAVLRAKGVTGPQVPQAGNSGNPLPTVGIVTGFGVFLDQVTGRVRIDNFTLKDNLGVNGISPQPIPTRPTSPSSPPSDPDLDPESDPNVPNVATPTPSPAGPIVAYRFCPLSQKHSKRLVASRTVRSAVIRKLSKRKSISALQERIIVELLLGGIRADSLQNVRISDYYSANGKLYLNVFGLDRRAVRISGKLVGILSTYIQKSAIGGDPASPLFRSLTGTGAPTLSALCEKPVSKILSKALRRAGVTKKVKFKS